MTHYRGIEGLRAWLSWVVVFSHIVIMTGVGDIVPALRIFQIGGDFAVCVFIMVSGFVITSLILEKQEDYKTYITRRFLRIYPVYIICLILGIIASDLYTDVMMSSPWGTQSPPTERLMLAQDSLFGNGYLEHILAHVTMLHGAIPNNVLYDSQYMFLAPAWSLSLEWQFYLVAPLLIKLIQTPRGAIIATLATLAGMVLYKLGMFGSFRLPSILPGSGLFFAVGIATRMILPRLPRLKTYPVVALLLVAASCGYGFKMLPFVIFLIAIVYLLVDTPQDKIGQYIEKTMHLALDSPLARYMGKISYSTYLIHAPIIQLVIYISYSTLQLGLWPTIGVLVAVVPILTFAASALINRYIEVPAIQLGRHIFQEKKI